MADYEVSQETQNVFPASQRAYCAGQPILNEWTNHSAFYSIYPSYYFTFANEFDEINPQMWECFIEIQPNGESHITMQTKKLNPMIYQGYMEIEKNNK